MSAPISRTQAWCKLAILIADGLPAPLNIRFQDEESGRPICAIHLDTAVALHTWSERLDLRISTPHANEGTWIHGSYGQWNGWALSLSAYEPVSAEPEPEPVTEDLTSVRAIAEVVSE